MRTHLTLSGVALVAIAAALCSSRLHFAQASYEIPDDLQPGRIIERVVCKNAPNQSYALYLPSTYSSTRKWPLLVAFDPGARGNAPVEHFKEAAERYGYIVCGSNTSRNGPLPPSAEAAKAMLGDVAARFSIDDKRVYLTGFSGGARAASAIAVWLSGSVAGLIGCGAGLATPAQPSASLPSVFFGTVGVEDFNYPEMKQLNRTLEAAGVPHRIEVFDGGHSWAPPEVCVRAIEWMELQAMKSARRSRDDSFIDRLLKNAHDRAIAEESNGRAYEAHVGYAGIAADFKGLKDVTEFEKKAASLKGSKAVKQAISKDRDQENEQFRRVSELFGLGARLSNPATRGSSPDGGSYQGSAPGVDSETRQTILSDLRDKLSDLKRKSEAKEGSPERALARRVLSQFRIASLEQSMTMIQTKKYDLAASNMAIDAELMPDNWRLLYNLACAYALKGDKRRAIETLNKAVQKGFKNAAELERNDQLDAIRDEAGFKKIIEGLKKQ
jgi:dienelactone hydrolase